ncbi:MAG: RidA family protein [Tissierellia bacterium]|nr:RidA family protein [Tissierellia bacterium]
MLETIQTKNAPAAVGPYSQGMIAGDMIFTSGQLPIIPATGDLVRDDVKKAARQSLENVKAILEEAGSTMEKVVKVNIFLADINDFGAVNEVYSEYFSTHKPARSCVQVAHLPLDGLLEIEAIAVK